MFLLNSLKDLSPNSQIDHRTHLPFFSCVNLRGNLESLEQTSGILRLHNMYNMNTDHIHIPIIYVHVCNRDLVIKIKGHFQNCTKFACKTDILFSRKCKPSLGQSLKLCTRQSSFSLTCKRKGKGKKPAMNKRKDERCETIMWLHNNICLYVQKVALNS